MSALRYILFSVLLAQAIPPSQGNPQTMRIGGRVVDEQGEGLAGASVRVSRVNETTGIQLQTNADGEFIIDGLSAGWYNVRASLGGFVAVEYGAAIVGEAGTPVVVDGKSTYNSLVLRLPSAAVIGGVARDPEGHPLGNTKVDALQSGFDSRGLPTHFLAGSALSDDRGWYRIGDLPPGSYIIRATPPRAPISSIDRPDGRSTSSQAGARMVQVPLRGFAETYYPGQSTYADAVAVLLGSGDVRRDADIFVKRVVLTKINGRLIMNGSGSQVELKIQKLDAFDVPASLVTAPSVENNSFTVSDLTPGQYLIKATARRDRSVVVAGSRRVEVREGQETVEVILPLTAISSVAVRATFDINDAAAPGGIWFALYEVDRSPHPTAVATLQSDGTLIFQNVEPGSYRLERTTTSADRAPWPLKSARVNGIETVDGSFSVRGGELLRVDLVFSKRPGQILGT